MNFKNILKFKKGFILVEAIIAVSIIVVSILAVMTVAQKSIYISRQSVHITQASFLLEEGAEIVRIYRDSSWSNISSLVVGTNYYPFLSLNTWSLSLTPNTVGIFTRTVSVSNVKRDNATSDISDTGADDVGTKLFTVTVSWLEGGATLTKTLSFYLTDIFS